MADSGIGPLAIKAILDAKGIDTGIDQAKAKLKAGAPKLAEEAGKAGEKAGDSAGRGFASKFGLGIAGLFATGAVGLAGSYALGAGYIRDIGLAARAASVPMREFQSIASAFGKNEDALDGLTKLHNAMAKAAVTGEGVAAFSRLGLDPEKLLAGGNAFEQVADKVQALGGGFQQAWAAQQIFGEEYKKFLPVLSQGGEFIREQRDMLAGFGATANEGTFAAVRTADKLFAQFGALKQGFFVQVTEGLAPLLAALSEKLPKLYEVGLSFKGFGQGLASAIEGIAKFGGSLFESFRDADVRSALFELFDQVMRFAADKFSEYMMTATGKLLKAIGKIEGPGGFTIADLGAAGDRLLGVAGDARDAAGRARVRMRNNWAYMMDAFAQTPTGSWMGDLFSREQKFRAWPSAWPGADPFAIWEESAARLLSGGGGGGGSPLEKFKSEWNTLNRLQEKGREMMKWDGISPTMPASIADSPLFKIAGEQGDLMRGKLIQGLMSQASSGGSRLSGALVSGTAAATSAVNQARFSARESVPDLLKQMIENQKEQIRISRENSDDPEFKLIINNGG